MRRQALPYLACLACRRDLALAEVFTEDAAEHVLEGILRCSQCQKEYAVTRGIPRLLPEHLLRVVRDNVSSFAKQWQAYDKILPQNQQELESYIAGSGLTLQDFQGKCVLDAGCGSGKFTAIVGRTSTTIGMDLSDSVEVAFEATRHLPAVHIIQADISQPPLHKENFDLIYSIGVLHHSADPPKSFRALLPLLKRGGYFFFWLYAKEGNELYLRWVDPIRHHLTRHLPFTVNHVLAWILAICTWPVLLSYGALASVLGQDHSLRRRLPMFDYLLYFRRVGFWLWRNTILDKLIPHIAHHYSRGELVQWTEGLELVSIDFRNGNSWGVLVRKPLGASGSGNREQMVDQNMFDAVILDMDGVITKTATLHAQVWKQMFDQYLRQRADRDGIAYKPFSIQNDYRQYVDGKPRYDGVRSFLLARGIELPEGTPDDPPSQETICGLGNRKNLLFHELIRKAGVDAYEDTIQQVHLWQQLGKKLAVISSSRNCTEILQGAGVLDLFEVRVDGNDLEKLGLHGKPAPDMFLHAAALLDVAPGRAVIVEDAISGVQAGRAGGFALVVGVAREGNTEQLLREGADIVVDDLRKLHDLEGSSIYVSEASPGEPASGLEQFAEIATRLADHELALFLDYDGTLTPIVDRPEDARLSEQMRALLSQLSQRFSVAIVSGRDLADVRQMVALDNLVYAGSHGYDIAGPGGLRHQHDQAQQCLPDLEAAERELRAKLADIEGTLVERKHFAVAIHYRLAADADQQKIQSVVDEVHSRLPRLRKKGGKKIYELQPDVPWHKGRAVLWLRQTLSLDRPDIVTLYLGDDETDEDAFAALAEQDLGIGIIVGRPSRPTHARYTLEDVAATQRFLAALLNLSDKN